MSFFVTSFIAEPVPSSVPASKAFAWMYTSMSVHFKVLFQLPGPAGSEPKLSELARDLKILTWSNVKELAVQLEVAYDELLRIEEQTQQSTDRMHRAMNLWLKKDSNASWEKVINALSDIGGKEVLVQSLKKKYYGKTFFTNIANFYTLCLSLYI